MPLPLFFFGTLMDADVLGTVLGHRPPAGAMEPAWLPGWHRVAISGRAYPMLVPRPTGRVDGILVHGLDAKDRRRLDHYEGDEYVLAELEVATGGGTSRALVYACRPGIRAGRGTWRLEEWRRRHKPAALARIRAWMAGIRRWD